MYYASLLLFLSLSLPLSLSPLSQDNQILFWDIRKTKSPLLSLDQHNGSQGSSKRPIIPYTNTHQVVLPIMLWQQQRYCILHNWLCSIQSLKQYQHNFYNLECIYIYLAYTQWLINLSFINPPSLSLDSMAHNGYVCGIQFTSDGLFLVSSGSDQRIKLWDVSSGCNMLVSGRADGWRYY